MKWTKILISILCLICLLTTGYVTEGSSQLTIAVPNLLTNLPIDWRPLAGKRLSFNVKVTKPAHYSGGRLTATLSEVTSYPGKCGNKQARYLSDLLLRQLDPGYNPGWRVETLYTSLSHPIEANLTAQEKTEWITLEVSCEDYAAYGKLTFATTGSSIAEAAPYVITIPRDVNGNKIADGWRNDETTADPTNNNPSKNYVASWDEESGPPAPNAQRGDNLTVLDEYRGLYVNGTWTTTDPEGWDVFIMSESGLGVASSLPGMTPHLMGQHEVTHAGGEVLDYQASNGWDGSNVYAIRLANNSDAFDEQNPEAHFGEMVLGPPSSSTQGQVFPERIRGWAILKQIVGQTADVLISQTVGHEIAHGVHLHHCPNGTDLDCYMWEVTDSVSQYESQWHDHHLVDYDLKRPSSAPQTPTSIPAGKTRGYDPGTGTWSLVVVTTLDPTTVTAPRDDPSDDPSDDPPDETPNEIQNPNIRSTNTGSSTYGCDYNAEYDYCTDTGTCTTRTDATGVGMCGHRWCCCAPADTTTQTPPSTPTSSTTPPATSTNTGSSSYGCDYNAEYDYCTDTGTCTTRSGEFEIGMCGHRWCCCAPE